MPRIGLIHAVAVAVEPVRQAFAELWAEAVCVNILDDSLSGDRARDINLTPAMRRRIGQLGEYVCEVGADAVLYTCSAFGPAIEDFARTTSRPVLKPNEAMFRQAIKAGRHIGMLATFEPAVASMEEEFRDLAGATGPSIRTVMVEQAMTALRDGDAETHNRLLASAASSLVSCDAVMLAHFSTSRALAAVSEAVSCPVFAAPHSAVSELRSRYEMA